MTYEKTSRYTFTIEYFCDGDTVVGYLTCGCCGAVRKERLRLPAIESWEIHSPEKARALEAARTGTDLFRGRSGVLTSRSLRRDKYGRIISDVIVAERSLAIQLVERKLAWYGVGEPDPGTSQFVSSADSTPS
jgi:endonuclease YncB( thermonuclease family)